MSVRVTILALLFGAMVLGVMGMGAIGLGALGGASAAERPGASGAPTNAPDHFPVASDVRLGGDDTQTRLIVDLTEKVEIRAFTLANPYRVVLDMPQVTFQFPARAGEAGRGLIKAFRFRLGEGGRLAQAFRSGPPGAGREGFRPRRPQLSARAPGSSPHGAR